LKRVAESYRRIRNTGRFLLGNLAGFAPATDQVPLEQMVAVDRWALWRTQQLQSELLDAYRNYQFHLIYQKVHNFCSVDLGGFYLDVLKDRLYTTGAKSAPRRSAQTAMYWIAEALVRWLAPILSFTSEEIWRYMPGERDQSVFFQTWLELPKGSDAALAIDWDAVFAVRAAVSRELEKLRVGGAIGGPLDAEIDLYCAPTLEKALAAFGEELRFAFITSAARVHPASERPAHAVAAEEGEQNSVWIVVRASEHGKCIRCWHKRPDFGTNPQHPELCGRCVINLEGPGETRHFS
jgi:isoleucyl-tRNA synthetase